MPAFLHCPPNFDIKDIKGAAQRLRQCPSQGLCTAGPDHMTAGLLITAAPRWINSSSLGHGNLSHAGMSGSPTLLKASTDVSLSQPLAFSHVRDSGLNGTAASVTPLTKWPVFRKHSHVACICMYVWKSLFKAKRSHAVYRPPDRYSLSLLVYSHRASQTTSLSFKGGRNNMWNLEKEHRRRSSCSKKAAKDEDCPSQTNKIMTTKIIITTNCPAELMTNKYLVIKGNL